MESSGDLTVPAKESDQLTDRLAKNWLFLAAGTYAAGYLVISIYHSSLGFSEADAIGPRNAAAGLVFLAIAALAIWLLRYVRLTSDCVTGPLSHWHRWFYFNSVVALDLLVRDAVFAFTVQPLFRFRGEQFHSRAYGWTIFIELLVLSALYGGVGLRSWVTKLLAHWAFMFVCFFSTVALLLLSLPTHGQFGIRQFAGFLFIAQLATLGVGKISLKLGSVLDQSWTIFVAQMILPVFLYGAGIYPHVRAAIGGGEPLPAEIKLKAVANQSSPEEVKAEIVDETTSGFYLMLPNGRGIRFIPRDSVESVVFGAPTSVPSK